MSIDSREGKYYPVCDFCGYELEGRDTFKEAVEEAEEAGFYYDRKEEVDYCEYCREIYGVD